MCSGFILRRGRAMPAATLAGDTGSDPGVTGALLLPLNSARGSTVFASLNCCLSFLGDNGQNTKKSAKGKRSRALGVSQTRHVATTLIDTLPHGKVKAALYFCGLVGQARVTASQHSNFLISHPCKPKTKCCQSDPMSPGLPLRDRLGMCFCNP